jgi:hypothetical protein
MPTDRLRLIIPLGLVSALTLFAGSHPAVLTSEMERVIEHVSSESLRGHLSFLASGLLEGRGTPSRGLDLAAEYIAAQFRRAGLEPAGDDGYFQTARMNSVCQSMEGFVLSLEGDSTARTGPERVSVNSDVALDLSGIAVFKAEVATLGNLKTGQVAGKAIAIALPENDRLAGIIRELTDLKPAVILDTVWKQLPARRLNDPSVPARAPWITLADSEILKLLHSAKPGLTGLRLSARLAAPEIAPAVVRNVIGLLRGSDPALKDSYVLLTAHYDHLGKEGDRVYYGANDDGSGTASVVEIGQALAAAYPHPRRSIVLMTFFGEEEGSLGALYYSRHPIFPLNKTVADLNLEQLGRTDSSTGPQVANATLTGFDLSDVGAAIREAGKLTGIKVYRSGDGGEPYFNRSDNIVFARNGIPAHTIVVAYEYPDYHGLADTWQKVDYNNMAKVDRMIAVAVILVADKDEPPRWNVSNPKAAPYRLRTD